MKSGSVRTSLRWRTADKDSRERFVHDLNATEDQITAAQKDLTAAQANLQAAKDDLARQDRNFADGRDALTEGRPGTEIHQSSGAPSGIP